MSTTSPRNERDDLEQIVSTPEEVSDNALTTRRSASAVESIGVMPLILAAAAVVLVALLVFGEEAAPNQIPEPRSGQTSTPPQIAAAWSPSDVRIQGCRRWALLQP